jgi:hypothetical protein
MISARTLINTAPSVLHFKDFLNQFTKIYDRKICNLWHQNQIFYIFFTAVNLYNHNFTTVVIKNGNVMKKIL